MIDNFIDSAIIIDDKEEEIRELIIHLEEKDIWTKHYLPEACNALTSPLRNRKIIFLDLYVGSDANVSGHISIIRRIFSKTVGKEFGTYGIVLWSAHTNEIDLLKEKMQLDAKEYTLPLFIVGLDKTKYIKEGFDTLFADLNQELHNNIAAKFFIIWSNLVSQGKDKAVTNIYSLIEDYDKQDMNLQFVLFQMAKNYTGIPFENIGEYPLHIDAFKAFNDMMNYEITTNQNSNCSIFDDINDIFFVGMDPVTEHYKYGAKNHIHTNINDRVIKKDGNVLCNTDQENEDNKENIKKLVSKIIQVYSYVNSKVLIDENNIQQSEVLPGNIYEIIDDSSHFIKDTSPDNSFHILIEMTPPCDYSNNKMINPRVLEGFMCDYSKSQHDKYKYDFYYKIWPLETKNKENPQMIVFDFRHFGFIAKDNLKDTSKYRLLYRAKDRLFADILQKLSSHTARLGLSIIN